MGESVYARPTVANRVLYVTTKTHLYAIAEGENYLKKAATPPTSAAGS